MRRVIQLLAVVLVLSPTASAQSPPPGEGPPEPREGAEHAVPLYGELVRIYDAPEDPYAPGHRGVDVAAALGSPVRASDDGVVTFAGSVAGNLSVTVDHGGGLRTSYSFLASIAVTRERSLQRGEIVGTVGTGHGSGLPPHVHLSARRDGVYFDPVELYVGSSYADLLSLTA